MGQRSTSTPSYGSLVNPPLASRRSSVKVAIIGSSYTQQCTELNSSVNLVESSRSWLQWWNIFAGGILNIDNFIYASDPLSRGFSGSNFGVSGQNSDTILARLSQVIAARPDICVAQMGSNNVTDVETVVSNAVSAIDRLFAAGILPVFLGISNRGAGSWASNQPLQAAQINQRVKAYCRLMGRGIFIDPNIYIIDNSAETGRPYTNAIDSDEIHYNQYSGFQVGKILHQVVTPLLPLSSGNISYFTDAYEATYNPYGNTVTNPFMSTSTNIGTANGTVGTGVTAGTGTAETSVARNMTIERNSGSGTGVATLESRGAGLGSWQVLTVTPAAAAATSVFYIRRGSADQTTGLPPVGTWVQGVVDVDISAFGTNALYSGFRGINLFLDFRAAGGTLGTAVANSLYSSSYNLPNEAWSGRLVTPPYQLPATFDRMRYRLEVSVDDNMTGTGVAKAGSLSVRPVVDPTDVWGF